MWLFLYTFYGFSFIGRQEISFELHLYQVPMDLKELAFPYPRIIG